MNASDVQHGCDELHALVHFPEEIRLRAFQRQLCSRKDLSPKLILQTVNFDIVGQS